MKFLAKMYPKIHYICNYSRKMSIESYQLNLGNKLFDLSSPTVMGIINVTPDSFYAKSRIHGDRNLIQKVEEMVGQGMKILDLGAYSTRPNASPVPIEAEIKRLADALSVIRKKFPSLIISIDTFRAQVAREMVADFQVEIINDISGGTLDPLMFETIGDLKVAYVLMHTRGNPENMNSLTDYTDVVAEVFAFLSKRIAQLRVFGVNDIIIDPGFGFAKTLEQNFLLLKNLHYFQELNCPILAGLSRKSMIYKFLENTADEALNGTTALNMIALNKGASILRVHDVKEAVECVKLFDMLCN